MKTTSPFAICTVLAVIAAAAPTSARAQAQPAKNPPPRPAPMPNMQVLRIVARPAPLPTPPLKYQFLPDLIDQTPGNAALSYLAAAKLYETQSEPQDEEKMEQWRGLHPSQLPRDEVRALLGRYSPVFRHLREARLRDRCDFETNYRTEGFAVLLPHLNDMRVLANLTRLSINLNIAEEKFDQAVSEMGVTFAMSRHLCEQPFLVQVLVATGIDSLGQYSLQQFITSEDSPNLYWAVGDLAPPLVDPRAAMRYERAGVYYTIPHLKDALDAKLTTAQWNRALAALMQFRLTRGAATPRADTFLVPLATIKDYTRGKQHLIEQRGIPREKVEAMEVATVVGAYHAAQFERHTQEYDKWLTLPFWQGFEKLVQLEQRLDQAKGREPWSLSALFLPSVTRFYATVKRNDRMIAAWRTVEALRAYAAANAGNLPERLEDMTDTPAPIDPMTDEPFTYKVEGATAVIEGKPIQEEAGPRMRGLRFELTLVK